MVDLPGVDRFPTGAREDCHPGTPKTDRRLGSDTDRGAHPVSSRVSVLRGRARWSKCKCTAVVDPPDTPRPCRAPETFERAEV